MEDVDALQLELEAMLAATVVKKRTVAHEAKLIEDMERRGGSSSSKGPYLHDDHRLFRYLDPLSPCPHQCCQMAKFDPFLSLDCAGMEGVGRNPRKGRDQILQRSVAEP